jgi:hypothetical protein
MHLAHFFIKFTKVPPSALYQAKEARDQGDPQGLQQSIL